MKRDILSTLLGEEWEERSTVTSLPRHTSRGSYKELRTPGEDVPLSNARPSTSLSTAPKRFERDKSRGEKHGLSSKKLSRHRNSIQDFTKATYRDTEDHRPQHRNTESAIDLNSYRNTDIKLPQEEYLLWSPSSSSPLEPSRNEDRVIKLDDHSDEEGDVSFKNLGEEECEEECDAVFAELSSTFAGDDKEAGDVTDLEAFFSHPLPAGGHVPFASAALAIRSSDVSLSNSCSSEAERIAREKREQRLRHSGFSFCSDRMSEWSTDSGYQIPIPSARCIGLKMTPDTTGGSSGSLFEGAVIQSHEGSLQSDTSAGWERISHASDRGISEVRSHSFEGTAKSDRRQETFTRRAEKSSRKYTRQAHQSCSSLGQKEDGDPYIRQSSNFRSTPHLLSPDSDRSSRGSHVQRLFSSFKENRKTDSRHEDVIYEDEVASQMDKTLRAQSNRNSQSSIASTVLGEQRSVYIGDPIRNADLKYCGNVVTTSKYTVLTFLPKFAFESFRKLANLFFLIVSIMQTIPRITNTDQVPTNAPVLIFILAVDAVFAILEDRRRQKADRKANSAICLRLSYGEDSTEQRPGADSHSAKRGTWWGVTKHAQYGVRSMDKVSKDKVEMQSLQRHMSQEEERQSDKRDNKIHLSNMTSKSNEAEFRTCKWSDVKVGDILMVKKEEIVPADLLLLAVSPSSDVSGSCGICYVETKSLDGETNLKLRQAMEPTMFNMNPKSISELRGGITFEQPSAAISKFSGSIRLTKSGAHEEHLRDSSMANCKSLGGVNNSLRGGCLRGDVQLESLHSEEEFSGSSRSEQTRGPSLLRSQAGPESSSQQPPSRDPQSTYCEILDVSLYSNRVYGSQNNSPVSTGFPTPRHILGYQTTSSFTGGRVSNSELAGRSRQSLLSRRGEENAEVPFSIKNVLLRGCTLKNTDWVYGVVLCTGPDTRIMQSASSTPSKESSLVLSINRFILGALAALLVLCALSSFMYVSYIGTDATLGGSTQGGGVPSPIVEEFRDWFPQPPPFTGGEAVEEFIYQCFYIFLLMYQVVPISLYVSISTVHFAQAYFMSQDLEMYGERYDQPLLVRSMSLNEELGQVSHVFSDKTGGFLPGSLILEFVFAKFSLNVEANMDAEILAQNKLSLTVPPVAAGGNPTTAPYVSFEGPQLFRTLQGQGDEDVQDRKKCFEFFKHLALCHTVIPEKCPETGETRLSASSPDEQALVSAAKFFGFSFESRKVGAVTLRLKQYGDSDREGSEEPSENELADEDLDSSEHFGEDGVWHQEEDADNNLLNKKEQERRIEGDPNRNRRRKRRRPGANQSVPNHDENCSPLQHLRDKPSWRNFGGEDEYTRHQYLVLEVLEFNSKRKRMSIIVRDPEGRLQLLTKGADNVLFPRLRDLSGSKSDTSNCSLDSASKSDQSSTRPELDQTRDQSAGKGEETYIRSQTRSHLLDCKDDGDISSVMRSTAKERKKREAEERKRQVTMMHLDQFAKEGLRTLVLTSRELSEEFYRDWSRRYKQACANLIEVEKHSQGRDSLIDACMDEMESDLELLGATAIEDCLQQGVPDSIETLAEAGMALWVLTGDKTETALNIATAARLIRSDSMISFLTAKDVFESNNEAKSAATGSDELVADRGNELDEEISPRKDGVWLKDHGGVSDSWQPERQVDHGARRSALSDRKNDRFINGKTFRPRSRKDKMKAKIEQILQQLDHVERIAEETYGGRYAERDSYLKGTLYHSDEPKAAFQRTSEGGRIVNSFDRNCALGTLSGVLKASHGSNTFDQHEQRLEYNRKLQDDEGNFPRQNGESRLPSGKEWRGQVRSEELTKSNRLERSPAYSRAAPRRRNNIESLSFINEGPEESESGDSVHHIVHDRSAVAAVDRAHCKEQLGLRKEDSVMFEGESDCDMSDVFENDFVLVIDGEALEVALGSSCRSLFASLSLRCRAVLCCRVSPGQKAAVVSMVREFCPSAITLSIGDGANDVPMLQAAHIGVGISGVEGMQAVNASDFAFAQFRFLPRLLLVHGRWNYSRMCRLILYMFYKNTALVLTQYWYSLFLSKASGQKFYLEMGVQVYNVLYTSLPILLLAVFDQDVSAEDSMLYLNLYEYGMLGKGMGWWVFIKWMAAATFESFVIFFMTIYGYAPSDAPAGSGSKTEYGMVAFTLVILTANLKLLQLQQTWTMIAVISLVLSILFWPVTALIATEVPFFCQMEGLTADDCGGFVAVASSGSFWLLLPLAVLVALLRSFVWSATRSLFLPDEVQVVQQFNSKRHTEMNTFPSEETLSQRTSVDMSSLTKARKAIDLSKEPGRKSLLFQQSFERPTLTLPEILPLRTKSEIVARSQSEKISNDTHRSSNVFRRSYRKSATSARNSVSFRKSVADLGYFSERRSSGFAFDYDPDTHLAESFLASSCYGASRMSNSGMNLHATLMDSYSNAQSSFHANLRDGTHVVL